MPIERALLRRTSLSEAVRQELSTRNRLLPRRWDYAALAADPSAVETWLRPRLRRGLSGRTASVVFADKGWRGARPLHIMALEDRVLYRALVGEHPGRPGLPVPVRVPAGPRVVRGVADARGQRPQPVGGRGRVYVVPERHRRAHRVLSLLQHRVDTDRYQRAALLKLLPMFAQRINGGYDIGNDEIVTRMKDYLNRKDQSREVRAAALELLRTRGFTQDAARKWLQRHRPEEAFDAWPRGARPAPE